MKEKKGKKEKGKKRRVAASTDRREGAAWQLHGGTRRAYCLHGKLKSSMGSNFSHAVVLSPPFGYVALSHLARILMPLHSFVLLFPSPSLSVCCPLDKFSFFFSPFISNLCRTMSTAISPSPPPTPVTATSKLPLP